MEFETRENYEINDSRTESKIQLVFVPGIGGENTWKHQVKYFSKRYRTITYRRKIGGLENSRETLENILKNEGLENVVLVGSDVSNRVVQAFSERSKVVSTVMTNFSFEIPEIRREMYLLLTKSCRKPKLLKKLFLSEKTNYRIARELASEIRFPNYGDYCSYQKAEAETDIENGMVIQASEDRFSSLEDAKKLQPDVTVREVAGGSFCFYEKPEEFNKALSEFTERLETFIQSKQIREKRERNRSLQEFENRRSYRERMELREQ